MSANAQTATAPQPAANPSTNLATKLAPNLTTTLATEPATKPAPAIKPLSERQASCLHWAAMGKTSWETARILGVSESTVNFHLCNACDKLGVRGRRAAVVMAMKLGLIASLTA